MERYICVHGHFYQPPRENAWLENIEMQDSAYPYHDWNERITAECYAPNMASRILDGEGYITRISNNYARISFNFGPTLLMWLEKNEPEVYQSIIDTDRESQQTFSGHGSALAQAYNHMIMPLANHRDKYTQVLWGIRDFEHRFKRKPEGMWLPETAVDLETLDIMAGQEIRFTILAPHQAGRVRQIGTANWSDTKNGSIDPSIPYEINLPSGRKINIFFYDGSIANDVAFGNLLKSGDSLANRLTGAVSKERTSPQLVHVATDGETYGHHHRFGDMALAFALYHIESNNLAKITNYGQFLEKHPPTHEVEIIENTSWSCAHGIERWRSNCGCNAGRNSNWNQEWRPPLRASLDWLRDSLAPTYGEKARELLKDPWSARDDYIEVILDRSPESVRRFLEKHRTRELNETEVTKVLKFLELQRHAMLMYTSCGWFFDEMSGIETVQVIQYAGRTVQLAKDVLGDNIEEKFLEHLELAKSNIRKHSDGKRIYEKFVKPAMVDLNVVTTHFAISSLFEEYGKQAEIYCYRVSIEDYQTSECGKAKLAAGHVRITSVITGESGNLCFGVLHFGDHNVNAGVREYQGEEAYRTMVAETTQTCAAADFSEVIRLLDKHFGSSTYSIRNLFRDEQRKVLDNILESALSDIEAAYYQVYEHYYPPMRFISELGSPIPRGFQSAAEFILNNSLRKAFSSEPLDLERIKSLIDETETWQVELDNEGLSYQLQQTLERMITKLSASSEDIALLRELLSAAEMARSAPFPVDLWRVQNIYHEMLQSAYPEFQKRAQQGEELAAAWIGPFVALGQPLAIRVG